MKSIKKRLTYANVMSSIAVFLVLGGATAIAAGLAKNSVGSKQLKKNAVTAAKIKKNAVTTPKIKNGAVTGSKLAPGAVNGAIGAGSITNDKLADGAVTGHKVAAGAVTGDKVAAGTIGRGNLAEGALIPRGYAMIEGDGEVDPAGTLNIPDASNPFTGVYCFDLSFAPKHAQATVEADTESNDFASVAIEGLGSDLSECPPGTELEVQTWSSEDSENELANEEFFVVVW